MTETQFITQEIATWGFDYIESLLNKGYEPRLTTKGWTWILPLVQTPTQLRQARWLALAA